MVIGLIMLIALFGFIKPKIDLGKGLTEEETKIPNPACYTECAMKISKEGGSYEDCASKCS
ncbi:hypothetical protein GQ473_05710 [archaeon]|nr:hypothetical protein [archaeon]